MIDIPLGFVNKLIKMLIYKCFYFALSNVKEKSLGKF